MTEVFEKDPSLYWDDGDFVVTATRSTDGVILVMRVDKVLLKRQSDVFKTTLSLPAPNCEQYDGVPRMHLPDEADDVRGLIAAMDDHL